MAPNIKLAPRAVRAGRRRGNAKPRQPSSSPAAKTNTTQIAGRGTGSTSRIGLLENAPLRTARPTAKRLSATGSPRATRYHAKPTRHTPRRRNSARTSVQPPERPETTMAARPGPKTPSIGVQKSLSMRPSPREPQNIVKARMKYRRRGRDGRNLVMAAFSAPQMSANGLAITHATNTILVARADSLVVVARQRNRSAAADSSPG